MLLTTFGLFRGTLKSHKHASMTQGTAKEAAPQALAWDHDVVLTTFTRLSGEWGGSDSGAASPLRQVPSESWFFHSTDVDAPENLEQGVVRLSGNSGVASPLHQVPC